MLVWEVRSMRMAVKFKDGVTANISIATVEESTNFFQGLQNGVNFNKEVIIDTPNGQIKRRYADVNSIEIFLHEI